MSSEHAFLRIRAMGSVQLQCTEPNINICKTTYVAVQQLYMQDHICSCTAASEEFPHWYSTTGTLR